MSDWLKPITKEILLSKLNDNLLEWIPNLSKQKYWDDIVKGINETIKKGKVIYPNLCCVFRALNELPLNKFRVLIIGQDPYPTPGFADGFSFSVRSGKQIPRSLANIFSEIDRTFESDMSTRNASNGDLEKWNERGVLLLNTVLTIGDRNESHVQIHWQDFTQDVIQYLDENYTFVTIAMGSYAKKVSEIITKNKANVITVGHPSPLNTTNKFYGCNCFEDCNNKLMENGLLPINWVF